MPAPDSPLSTAPLEIVFEQLGFVSFVGVVVDAARAAVLKLCAAAE